MTENGRETDGGPAAHAGAAGSVGRAGNAAGNPFCTRRIRPGAIPFIFPGDRDADRLIDRLRQNDWRAEILGPHGAGKSALLAALLPALERAGRKVVLVELHDGQRRLPFDPARGDWGPAGLIVVDGCEQLSRWGRWRLVRVCRRRGWGLLVTAHASVGLPQLCRVAATAELAEKIVAQLMAGETPPFSAGELSDRFLRHRGNLRETLLDLYDIYERRRPTAGQNLT